MGAVLAVVPAHDEAPRVAAVVRGLIEQGLPVLAVDDGSTDGTGEVAREAGARVLRLEPNQGKGAALKAGFRLALGETVSEALGEVPSDKAPGAAPDGAPPTVAASSPAVAGSASADESAPRGQEAEEPAPDGRWAGSSP